MGDTSTGPWLLPRMPWNESTQVQARVRFIEQWLADEYESLAALCAAHGVSRKTGYKWLARFKGGGTPSLADRPKRWKSHPQTTDATMVEMIVGARRRHPSWGPKKLHVWLERRGYEPPAVSTIGAILKREGCVKPRRRRERTQDYANGLAVQDAPNAVWAADFKGWFQLKIGMKCYPLTVSDGFSRYLLRCEALQHPDELACKEVFDGLFKEFGLYVPGLAHLVASRLGDAEQRVWKRIPNQHVLARSSASLSGGDL